MTESIMSGWQRWSQTGKYSLNCLIFMNITGIFMWISTTGNMSPFSFLVSVFSWPLLLHSAFLFCLIRCLPAWTHILQEFMLMHWKTAKQRWSQWSFLHSHQAICFTVHSIFHTISDCFLSLFQVILFFIKVTASRDSFLPDQFFRYRSWSDRRMPATLILPLRFSFYLNTDLSDRLPVLLCRLFSPALF